MDNNVQVKMYSNMDFLDDEQAIDFLKVLTGSEATAKDLLALARKHQIELYIKKEDGTLASVPASDCSFYVPPLKGFGFPPPHISYSGKDNAGKEHAYFKPEGIQKLADLINGSDTTTTGKEKELLQRITELETKIQELEKENQKFRNMGLTPDSLVFPYSTPELKAGLWLAKQWVEFCKQEGVGLSKEEENNSIEVSVWGKQKEYRNRMEQEFGKETEYGLTLERIKALTIAIIPKRLRENLK